MLLETGDLNKPIKMYSTDSEEVGAEIKCLEFRDMHNTIGYVNLELRKIEVTRWIAIMILQI